MGGWEHHYSGESSGVVEGSLENEINEFIFIDLTEGERERERDRRRFVGTLIYVFICIHSLVDYGMCPDWSSNPQPWRIRTKL